MQLTENYFSLATFNLYLSLCRSVDKSCWMDVELWDRLVALIKLKRVDGTGEDDDLFDDDNEEKPSPSIRVIDVNSATPCPASRRPSLQLMSIAIAPAEYP